jgi:hypothetical protein
VWFCSIDTTFAASRVTKSLTKFNWPLSKLLFSLIDSIGPLCKRPATYANPLPGAAGHPATLLWSQHLPENEQMARPPGLWHQQALRHVGPSHSHAAGHSQGDPDILFLHKLLRYIRDLISPQEFQEPEALIQRCNAIWEDRIEEEGAAAVATSRPPPPPSMVTAVPPLRSVGRVPLALGGSGEATAGVSTTPVSVPKAKKCEKGCSYQEN